MTTIHQKNQILESLNSLDHVQTEQVMDYINKLVQSAAIEDSHKKLKREALREIRQALMNNRKLVPTF